MTRNGRTDFYRGILMWMVVWGHVINALPHHHPATIHILFRTLDMPMFMLLGGYYCAKTIETPTSMAGYLLRRARRILLPALGGAVVTYLLGETCWYYFLWAIFACGCMAVVTNNIIRNKWGQIAVMAIVVIALHLLPRNVANLAFLMPFFVAGYAARLWTLQEPRRGFLPVLVGWLVLFSLWNPKYTIWNAGAHVDSLQMAAVCLFRLALGLTGIWVAKRTMDVVYDWGTRHDSRFVKLTMTIGIHSLAVYVAQHIIVEMGLSSWSTTWDGTIDNPLLTGYVVAPLAAFAVCWIIAATMKNLNKIIKL